MSTLHVLDVKQYMYIGQSKLEKVCMGVIEDNKEYRPNEMRVGSLCFLMSFIDRLLKQDPSTDIVLCFDSSPVHKRKLAQEKLGREYKGGRAKPPEHVTYQYKFSKIILPQIGFNSLIAEGLEADDLIASVVLRYKNLYDKVYIHSCDSDQYYLVDRNVEVHSIRSNGKNITMGNYRSNARKDTLTEYNTVNFYKLLTAESGDNVPSLNRDVAERLTKIILTEVSPFLGNMQSFRTVFKNIVGKDDEYSLAVFDMINPILVFDERSQIERSKSINYRLFEYYATIFGMEGYRSRTLYSDSLGESTIANFLDELNRR